MIRRLTLSALVAASTGICVLAASERATLVLTDGERKSGSLAFHLDKAETIINDQFQLNVAPGQEIQVPIDQIAVVEFLGGTPPVTELQALPSDKSHLLVMRNGSTQRGRLLNLTGGDTIKWRSDSGQAQDIPVHDVSRVYLNASVARAVFNYSPTGAATGAPAGQVLAPGAVRVDASKPWTSTGVSVKKGDRVRFSATGQIAFGQSAGQTAGPDGNAGTRNPGFPVAAMPVGGLVGKVGASAPFPIGSNAQPITMPADGMLMLGVNDNELGDNSGFFSVVVTKS